jgi:hypothetical protein
MIAQSYSELSHPISTARFDCARSLSGMRRVRKKLENQDNVIDFCNIVEDTWIKGGRWR